MTQVNAVLERANLCAPHKSRPIPTRVGMCCNTSSLGQGGAMQLIPRIVMVRAISTVLYDIEKCCSIEDRLLRRYRSQCRQYKNSDAAV